MQNMYFTSLFKAKSLKEYCVNTYETLTKKEATIRSRYKTLKLLICYA